MEPKQNAKEILGSELISVFQETYGDDPQALTEIMHEAVRAISIIRNDTDYMSIRSINEME